MLEANCHPPKVLTKGKLYEQAPEGVLLERPLRDQTLFLAKASEVIISHKNRTDHPKGTLFVAKSTRTATGLRAFGERQINVGLDQRPFLLHPEGVIRVLKVLFDNFDRHLELSLIHI